MPVTVRLLDLVALPGSQHLWPAEFVALMAKLEEDPRERAQWLVIADWLKENEELELESICRWIAARPKVQLYRPAGDEAWSWRGLPKVVENSWHVIGDRRTLPGAIANLHYRVTELRNDARRRFEELA